MLSETQRQLHRALVERIAPADDWPGAWEAGAEAYLQRQLAGDLAAWQATFERLLAAIDAEAHHVHGQSFTALSAPAQDALLLACESSENDLLSTGFRRLVEVTLEGFYADPANGGNAGAVSWRMIGYEPDPKRRPVCD
ncbi:MAG: gluconate 2-dehydrogenase subunit 3 family protein [Phycisphaeraceae bacterium]